MNPTNDFIQRQKKLLLLMWLGYSVFVLILGFTAQVLDYNSYNFSDINFISESIGRGFGYALIPIIILGIRAIRKKEITPNVISVYYLISFIIFLITMVSILNAK